KFYVRVVDCSSQQPVAGASVNLDNPGHRASSVTNMTGYAEIEGYAWFYTYYITASGYRFTYGERRFSIGEVFTTCLFRETGGFWRVVSDLLSWQGDIHAGGAGWGLVRLKNFESGVFNITNIELMVSGYDRPVGFWTSNRGKILPKLLDTYFNLTVKPPQDSPVGRLKAELRIKAVIIGDDGSRIGPLTLFTDLDYILIREFRSFNITVLDYWGFNRVPNASATLVSQLTGASYQLSGNAEGVVSGRKIPDGVYRMQVRYTSPYDRETYVVYDRFPMLADLAREGYVKTDLHEAHIKPRDLSGRPLNASVALGRVMAVAKTVSRPWGEEVAAVFVNVPEGVYPVRAFWKGVEVYKGEVRVDEPLARPDPGGLLEPVLDVGDIVIILKDAVGRGLKTNVTVSLNGMNQTGLKQVVYTRLPRGEHTFTVSTFNRLLGREVNVGTFTFRIPEHHGVHEVRLGIFDAVIRLQTADGRPAPIESLQVEGRDFKVVNGEASVSDITVGRYSMKAVYMGVTVLDDMVEINNSDVVVRTSIHSLRASVQTVDGEPLEKGLFTVDVRGEKVTAQIAGGAAYIPFLPAGKFPLKISVGGQTVYDGLLQVDGLDKVIIANAGRPVVYVVDQKSIPVESAEVEVVDVGKAVTGVNGSAKLGQTPVRELPYRVFYKGLEMSSGMLKPGTPVKTVVKLVNIAVRVVNELGSPTDSDVDLVRGGRTIARASGSEVRFDGVPSGGYSLSHSWT
ncbi:MAG: hypothetical protein QW351_08750, partial [Candidatus Caldarchaeum sp.]